MSDESDKIFVWFPGAGEVIPLRYHGWWVKYPKPSCSNPIEEPPENQFPVFQTGDLVRLQGKPDRARKILAVEWHRYRHEFAYIVETSDAKIFGYCNSPYWFASQLVLESAGNHET